MAHRFCQGWTHHPFVDSAKMISVLLFEHFPVPLTYEEVRAADVQRLMDFFALSAHHAEELAACVAVCATKTELVQRLVQEGVSPLCARCCRGLARTRPRARSSWQRRSSWSIRCLHQRREGAGEDSGGGVAAARLLWQMALRTPPQSQGAEGGGKNHAQTRWSSEMQTTFKCCTSVLKLACGLVAKCSSATQTDGKPDPSDLHPANFLLPLLVRALCSVRYVQLGLYQKRLAWYTANTIANLLNESLATPPTTPPEDSWIGSGRLCRGRHEARAFSACLVRCDAAGRQERRGDEFAQCKDGGGATQGTAADATSSADQQHASSVVGSVGAAIAPEARDE